MSIEEKAKAYDEALEIARQIHNGNPSSGTAIVVCEQIFPQLRESEDERIRKELVNFLQSPFIKENLTDEKVAPWLAWLEKQKINTKGDFGRGYDCGYQAGYAVAMNEMKPKVATVTLDSEKQKEQKQNQSEEEREYVKTLKGLISDFIRDSGGAISDVTYYQRICDWLDERHIEQKPTEYLDKDKVYAIMKKLHDLSFSQLIPINSDEYKKIDEITCDIRNFLNYPIEQKPLEKQDYSGLNDLERAIQEIVDLTKDDSYICDRMHGTHHGSEWCRLNCGDRTIPDFVCCKEWLFNHWKN